jgi:hypothetical protein
MDCTVLGRTWRKEYFMKRYKVTLTGEERQQLETIVKKGNHKAAKYRRAQTLLAADESRGGKMWTDERIHDAYGMSVRQIERLRKAFVEEGFSIAVNGRPPQPRVPKFDGDAEAHLIALACGKAPEGQIRWTLRLLADKMVEMEYVEDMSHESVRQLLKKRNQAVEEALLGDSA